MSMTAREVRKELRKLASPQKAAILRRFFKTGPGEYGEGDVFLGIPVPALRRVAAVFREMRLGQVDRLLQSTVHEERFVALLLLLCRFRRGSAAERRHIYRLYFRRTPFINSWDLVDLSAGPVVGAYLENRSREPVFRLAESSDLWERRIAVMATFPYVRSGRFVETLRLARALLEDEEPLIHKAVGWMLREIGKRDTATLEKFLRQHAGRMPRTMLRYAIERYPPQKRRRFLRMGTGGRS